MAIADEEKRFKKLLGELRETNQEIRKATTKNEAATAVVDIIRNDFDTLVGDIKTLGNDIASSVPGLRSVVGIGKYFGGKAIKGLTDAIGFENKEQKRLRESLGFTSKKAFDQAKKQADKDKAKEEASLKQLELIQESIKTFNPSLTPEELEKALDTSAQKYGVDKQFINKFLGKSEEKEKGTSADLEAKRDQQRLAEKNTKTLETINESILGLGKGLEGLKEKGGLGLGLLAGLLAAPVIALVEFFKSIGSQLKFLKDLTGRMGKFFEPIKSIFRFFGRLASGAFRFLDNLSGGLISRMLSPIRKIFDFFTDIIARFKSSGVGRLLSSVGRTVKTVFGYIRGFFQPIVNAFKSIIGIAKSSASFMSGFGFIGGIAKTIGSVLGKLFLPITVIMSVFDFVSGFMKGYEESGLIEGIKQGVISMFDGLIGGTLRLLTKAAAWILEFLGFDKLAASLTTEVDNILKAIYSAFSGIIDVVVGIFTFDVGKIVGGLGQIWDSITGIFLSAFNILEAFVSDIFDFLGFDISWNPLTIIKNFFGGVYDFFADLFGFGSDKEAEVEGEASTSPFDVVKTFFGNVFGYIGEKFTAFKDMIFGFLPSLPSISEITDSLIDFGKMIYNPETGEVFGFTLPELPSISDIFDTVVSFGKKIYDPATGEVFGFTMPELPSISQIWDTVTGYAKKVYNSETGEVFGFKLPELPSISQIFTTVKDFASKIYDPAAGTVFGYELPELPSISQIWDIVSGFASKIYDPATGAVFGFTLPELPSISMIVDKAKEFASKIYNPETGQVFGFTLPELPSISAIYDSVVNFSKKIYNPEDNTVFGYELPELPSISDITNKIIDFSKKIYDPEAGTIFGFSLPELPSISQITDKIAGFGKNIYNSETGEVFGFSMPELPSISDITTKAEDFAKNIYNSEDGTIFGFALPELPSISDIQTKLEGFAKKIYDSETGTIFGFAIPELPSINDITTKLENFSKNIYDPATGAVFGFVLTMPALPSVDDIKNSILGMVQGIWDYIKGLFKFDTFSDALASAINIFFMPYNLILGMVESIWNYIKGLFGFDTTQVKEPAEATAVGGVGGLVVNFLNLAIDKVKNLFNFDSISKTLETLNPLTLLTDFGTKVGNFFDGIFNFDGIKKTLMDNIPFADVLFGDGGETEKPAAKEIVPAIQIDPIDSKSVLASVFGEVNILEELGNIFSSLIDNLVTYLDTFLGEALGSLYTSRKESYEELQSDLKDELAESSPDKDDLTDLALRAKEIGLSQDQFMRLANNPSVDLATLEASTNGVNNRTLSMEEGSKEMAANQQPVVINNVTNNNVTQGGGGGAAVIPMPKPVTNPHSQLLAAVAAGVY